MQHKILIVDDETNVRFVIKEALSGAYQVFTAAEGLAAMEILMESGKNITTCSPFSC
ncbi:MAG: hypothetical protein ABIG11_07950 [bacterium]